MPSFRNNLRNEEHRTQKDSRPVVHGALAIVRRTGRHAVAECSTTIDRFQSPTLTAPAAAPYSAPRFVTNTSIENISY